ncbi:MAG: hypothetical protein KF768_09380 [Phycisphaeraceae bacterium]|nr:hypothetical protein [Phycisphaeraceae bacterium]
MLTISGKVLGIRRPLFADWAVPPPPRPSKDHGGDSGLTLRDLIEHVVRAEVAAFETRQEARRLDRVLTARQIAEGEARGRVAPEGRNIQQSVNIDEAIGGALQAFEDGLYLVIVDGAEHRDLDARVFLTPDSRITFLRLVMLAGG